MVIVHFSLPESAGHRVGRKNRNMQAARLEKTTSLQSYCKNACSQGVVGEGSTAEEMSQGQTAAARWLARPSCMRLAQVYWRSMRKASAELIILGSEYHEKTHLYERGQKEGDPGALRSLFFVLTLVQSSANEEQLHLPHFQSTPPGPASIVLLLTTNATTPISTAMPMARPTHLPPGWCMLSIS